MRKLTAREMERKSPDDCRSSAKLPLVLVLDNIRSRLNTGAVFRTADAFLVEKIMLCGVTATPPHRDIHKTALGATESVAWQYVPGTATLVQTLQREGYTVLALEQTTTSTPLHDFSPAAGARYALVFGNEVRGVDEAVLAHCDGSLEIPQFGAKHSLNVAVAAGIVLWDICTKLRAQGVQPA